MKTASESGRDYLAIILLGVGGSSYARGSDREDTIKRCASIARSDWKTLYDLSGELPVNVYDVTGRSKVWWDCRGVFSDEDDALGPIGEGEVVKVPPVQKRRR